jgi:large subunit ribosomal protein L4
MPSATVYNMDGEALREQALDDYVFGAPVNTAALHQVITAQLVNRRQGNADTKTRAEVSGGNKKPYRQKGTGRARQGSTRAPHFTGGGVVFGPQPHPYERAIPRKVKRLAIRSALSDKVANGRILLVENLTFEEGRTREMETFLATLPADRLVLIVMPERDEMVTRAAGNVHRVHMGHVSALNVYSLMKHDHVIMPVAAAEKIVELFGREADDALQTKRHPRVVLRRQAHEQASAKPRGKAATAAAEKPAAEKKPAREKKR